VGKTSESTTLWNKCRRHRGWLRLRQHRMAMLEALFCHRLVHLSDGAYRADSIRLLPAASDVLMVERARLSSLRHPRVEIYSPAQASTVLVATCACLVQAKFHGSSRYEQLVYAKQYPECRANRTKMVYKASHRVPDRKRHFKASREPTLITT
jgi:hypothetical protein